MLVEVVLKIDGKLKVRLRNNWYVTIFSLLVEYFAENYLTRYEGA